VYFRAWKNAEGQTLLVLGKFCYFGLFLIAVTLCVPVSAVPEHSCLQDLMNGAILAALPQTAKAIRRVLASFHDAKSQKGVCSLYSVSEL